MRTIWRPPPPNNIPPAPIQTHMPTIPEICNCIGRWTYFWSSLGTGWLYVTSTGIGIDPNTNTNQPLHVVWGCATNGGIGGIPLINITNYKLP